MNKILLGAHLSVSNGFRQTFAQACEIGANVVQVFIKSNRSFEPPIIDDKKIKDFHEFKTHFQVNQVVVHAGYLINLASVDESIFNKSVKSLTQELLACDLLSIPYLVLHPGSAKGSSSEAAVLQVAKALDYIYQKHQIACVTLIETMAGQGSTIGSLDEIAQIRTNVLAKNKVGFCLDTAHVFAYGWSIQSEQGFDEFLQIFDSKCGLENLKLIHLNDSVHEKNSKKDRHANVGQGKIGLQALKNIVHHPKLRPVAKILETPQVPDYLVYKQEIKDLLK